MRAVLLCGAVLGLGFPNVVRAQDIVLEPSSKWQLDYADEKCRLARAFGEGDRKIVLFMEQHEPSESFTWTVAGPLIGRFDLGRQLQVRFGTLPPPQRDRDRPGIFTGQLDDVGPALMGSGHKDEPRGDAEQEADKPGLPQLDPADGASIQWIELARGEKRQLRLNTGDMRAPFTALNQCTGNLVSHWGLDLEQQKGRTSRPKWENLHRVVRSIQEHYPAKALHNGDSARLNMRVMVGADGKPTACVLTHVTTANNFGDEPCRQVMRHARFKPARDAAGQTVASYHSTVIVYAIG